MNKPALLILGGSGFVSGTLARRAQEQGWRVWTVTRGQRALPDGVHAIQVDRQQRAHFAAAIQEMDMTWELVVDCICFTAEDARQDVEVLRGRAHQLVMVSTDFVYDPTQRQLPQPEEGVYQSAGYGGQKRAAEEVFLADSSGDLAWTILRPNHIYGPGSQLGCLPNHSRDVDLIDRLRARAPLDLVGGGHFLQQPVLALDLADLFLSVHGNAGVAGQIYVAPGPTMVESHTYYQIIADLLRVPLQINELSVQDYRAAHPEAANFLCHRIYDCSKLEASGLHAPSTTLEDGLRSHVESLLAAQP